MANFVKLAFHPGFGLTYTLPRPGDPLPLAESLLKTLQEEQDAVLRLGAHFDAHRASLRERRPDVLEEATLQANDLVAALARLRQAGYPVPEFRELGPGRWVACHFAE